MLSQQALVVGITVHGNRRIPADTVKARIFTKVGDVYDSTAIERDFNALWNAGYFEDIRFEREQSAKGWILHIYLKERPTIREINYSGLNAPDVSVTNADVPLLLALPGLKRLKLSGGGITATRR